MTAKLETPEELASALADLAEAQYIGSGEYVAGFDEAKATALLTAYLARRDAAVREAAIEECIAAILNDPHAYMGVNRLAKVLRDLPAFPTPPAEQKGGEHG